MNRRAFLGLVAAVVLPSAAAAQWDYGIRTPRPGGRGPKGGKPGGGKPPPPPPPNPPPQPKPYGYYR